MEKEFNVSIKPRKNNDVPEINNYVSDQNVPIQIKEVLLKSRLKKILIDYLNVETKSNPYLNMINEIERFIDNLNIAPLYLNYQ